ncbi:MULTISPECIES: hypothetical protein [unclassified Duganella]|jgi:predicted NAD/FAD-dependent oxidoreductase|uniref:hypothetical protein n=1 Tax=unclassified Duganella TaxID=2636909 RepID=UPI00088B94CD|nr:MULTISPECIES: hypothetical protein [unclassified Duganella]SDG77914.1 hypothetical protein SAMN05216320_10739 [Duganella sp. OV458]SDK04911.1 hypothetical protein SAMN05428973_10839 [Duganella sp. OV510]
MNAISFHVAVVGASSAGLACAQLLRDCGGSVSMFDPAQGATILDIWHDEGWRLASREQGTSTGRHDALVLALPAMKAVELLEPLLPMTAMRAFTMAPSRDNCLWLPAVHVGLCGDWLCSGKVRDGALSGRALAARLLHDRATLTTSSSYN